MDRVTVESMTASEVSDVIALGLSTKELHLQDDAPAYYDEEDLVRFVESPHDIALIAKVNGVFAGYRLATFNEYLREAYLIDTVVKEEFRGQGVASALYKRTFELLNEKKCKWAWVLVKEGNKPIVEVLTKKGFSRGSDFTAFYKVAPFE